MDKSPVIYKRRHSGSPLSELPSNASDVSVDSESGKFLLASGNERTEDVTPGKENVAPVRKSRKGWSDQPLPRKRTRSSTALEEDASLKARAANLFETLVGRKGKDKGKGVEKPPTPHSQTKDKGKSVEKPPTPHSQPKDKGKSVENVLTPRKQSKDVESTTPRKQAKDVEKTTGKHAKGVEKITPRKHTSKESPGGSRQAVLHSPIEFVREKQAMFAEIDAFELESEEEEPEETTGKGMESELEFDSSNGESAGESPNLKPEQVVEATNTSVLMEKESPSTQPEQAQEAPRIVEVVEKENG